jgi:chemotaxis protein MotA
VDILSIVGLFLALVAILAGAVLKGAGLHALISAAAFMIVFVGTLAAIFVQTPWHVMRHAMRIFPWVMKPPPLDGQQLIRKMVEWSNIARKQGLLGLEPVLEREPDAFVRKALQLVVDGSEPDALRAVMEVELNTREHADTAAAKVFEGMGVYSPTLGIIGAVLGLMAVMQNLADPSKLGHGIAAAFTATVYGIGLANLFFLPVAAKLKGSIASQTNVREMVIEGMLSIAQGENPRSIESKLQGYLHQARG